MRFPKSVVQVRECGIAFRYILPGHLGYENAARVSADADARALLLMIAQCVRGNADGFPRLRPGIFGRGSVEKVGVNYGAVVNAAAAAIVYMKAVAIE